MKVQKFHANLVFYIALERLVIPGIIYLWDLVLGLLICIEKVRSGTFYEIPRRKKSVGERKKRSYVFLIPIACVMWATLFSVDYRQRTDGN